MVSYQYSYLIGTIFMLLIWIVLFSLRKDTRKEMFAISLIFSILGFTEIIYVRDWWRPLTITNTIPGIESFLFTFAYAGIVAVIYGKFFKKRVIVKKVSKKREEIRNIRFVKLFLILVIIMLGGVYLMNLNTLQATLLSLIPGILYMWIKRKDLILNSLITAILSVVIMIPVFWFVEAITPGFVQEFWFFENVPNIIIFKVPIDDIIFYLFAGAFIGPLYEYWKEGKLINVKS